MSDCPEEDACSLAFRLRFHFILRFWNQIFTCEGAGPRHTCQYCRYDDKTVTHTTVRCRPAHALLHMRTHTHPKCIPTPQLCTHTPPLCIHKRFKPQYTYSKTHCKKSMGILVQECLYNHTCTGILVHTLMTHTLSHLCFGQHQGGGHLEALGSGQVLVEFELVLQLQQLLACEGRTGSTTLAQQARLGHRWREGGREGGKVRERNQSLWSSIPKGGKLEINSCYFSKKQG